MSTTWRQKTEYLAAASRKLAAIYYLSPTSRNPDRFAQFSQLSSGFTIKPSSKMQPHLKHVATLPCEVLV